MKGIRLTIDIEDVEFPDDLPENIRPTYERFDTGDEACRSDVADCVTAAIGAGGGVFVYNGDVSDLFVWLCEHGYVSVAVGEEEWGEG